MAVFDSNLMLRNTTETVGTNLSINGGLIGFTSNWLTLGTKVVGPLSVRIAANTCASSLSTMDFHFEQSDDQSAVKEDFVVSVTGTDVGAANLGWSTKQMPDIIARLNPRRTYLRCRAQGAGGASAWGTITIGVDAGDFNPYR